MTEAEIKRHQKLYYNGEPEISDEEFDALWDELESLDPGNPCSKQWARIVLNGGRNRRIG